MLSNDFYSFRNSLVIFLSNDMIFVQKVSTLVQLMSFYRDFSVQETATFNVHMSCDHSSADSHQYNVAIKEKQVMIGYCYAVINLFKMPKAVGNNLVLYYILFLKPNFDFQISYIAYIFLTIFCPENAYIF